MKIATVLIVSTHTNVVSSLRVIFGDQRRFCLCHKKSPHIVATDNIEFALRAKEAYGERVRVILIICACCERKEKIPELHSHIIPISMAAGGKKCDKTKILEALHNAINTAYDAVCKAA